MHRPHYIKGDWWMVCDVCAFDFRRSQMREQWDGVWACHGAGTNQCWSPKHPQHFVRGRVDKQTVNPSRPATEVTFEQVGCDARGVSALPGHAMPGCAIPGLVTSFANPDLPSGAPTTDTGSI